MSKKLLVPISALLIVMLLAGAWLVAPAAAADDDLPGKIAGKLARLRQHAVLGQITSLGEDEFTILTIKEETLTFLVNEDTRYRSREADALGFDSLATGQWVGVLAPNAGAEGEAAKRIARLVVILPEDYDPSNILGAVGKVTEITAEAGKFTLETRAGEMLAVITSDETRFMGGLSGLADLQVGMNVAVRGQKQEDGSLSARVVATRQEIERYMGEFTAVDESGGTLTLHTRRTDQDVTFGVDDQTKFRTKGGELDGLGAIAPGMVGLVVARPAEGEGEAVARLVMATSRDQLPQFDQRFTGRVVSVDKDSFTIETQNGEQVVFKVTGETTFRSRFNRVDELADLKEGMRVVVGAKELGNGAYHAQLVLVGQGLQ